MHPALLDRFSPGYSGSRSIAQVRADIRTEIAERAPRRVSGMMIAGWDPVWLLSSDRGKYAPVPHRVALAWMTGSALSASSLTATPNPRSASSPDSSLPKGSS